MGLDMYLMKKSKIAGMDAIITEVRDDGYKQGIICLHTVREVPSTEDLGNSIESYSNVASKKQIIEDINLPSLYDLSEMYMKDGRAFYVSTVTETTPEEVIFRGWKLHSDDDPVNTITVKKSEIESVLFEYAYWRKANQIHQWFVDHIQDGNDDCRDYEVSGEKLLELVELCKQVLNRKDEEFSKGTLPTQAGFFFGSTDYDDYYYEDLESTIKQLENVHPDEVYTYSSSW